MNNSDKIKVNLHLLIQQNLVKTHLPAECFKWGWWCKEEFAELSAVWKLVEKWEPWQQRKAVFNRYSGVHDLVGWEVQKHGKNLGRGKSYI